MCWGWITFLAALKARADCSGWWARTRTCSTIFCRNAGAARPRKNCPPATDFPYPHQGQHQSGVEGLAHGRLAVVEESRRPQGGGSGLRLQQSLRGICFAFEMSRHGVRTVYPRAIYMTGRRAAPSARWSDNGVFARWRIFSHPTGNRVVRKEYDYIHHLGFLERPGRAARDASDGKYYQAVNAKRACTNKLISKQTHGGTDADGHAPAGSLRFGRPSHLKPVPAEFPSIRSSTWCSTPWANPKCGFAILNSSAATMIIGDAVGKRFWRHPSPPLSRERNSRRNFFCFTVATRLIEPG